MATLDHSSTTRTRKITPPMKKPLVTTCDVEPPAYPPNMTKVKIIKQNDQHCIACEWRQFDITQVQGR